jgi:hypothetical protein
LLWWFAGRGVAQRAGWVRPDPTPYRDGLPSWVLLAAVVTAVDLVLVLAVHLLAGRSARSRAAHAVGVAALLLAAAGLAAAYLGR